MNGEAIKSLRRKLKKARENGRLQEISDCCCNLAAYLSEEEEHEEALTLYKESLAACEALDNKEGIALANRMIAEECINLGYFDDALDHVTLFLKFATDTNDKVEEQRGLVLKGHVYFTQAEYLRDTKPDESKRVEELLELSMEAYRKSYAICTNDLKDVSEKERQQMKARLLQNKSLVLSRQNKFEYAQNHLIRAIKICSKEKLNETEHLCYLSLGELYLKKNELQKALHVYDKAFEMSHAAQKKRDSLMGKAKVYIAMEDYQQAKNVLKKTYKVKNDFEVKTLLKQVATIIKLESNICSTHETDIKARSEIYKKLGEIYCSLKNYSKGIRCYLNVLGCYQKDNSNGKDLVKCYSMLCKAFINNKQYDKALFYSNQEAEALSKLTPEKALRAYFRIGKLHELNNSEFEDIHFAYEKAKLKALQYNNLKFQIKCLKQLIEIGHKYNSTDVVNSSENELKILKNKDDLNSSCDSENESESDFSNDSDNEESSDTDFKNLISDSDVENEEYDRPKERCKRTKFIIKRNEKGETELHVAAIKGNYKRVRMLLEKGHPVNLRDTAGWTPLHEACNHGFVDIVNILLDFGADINDKGGPSCDGTTPLHDAATNGQLVVLETLIKRGASTLVLNDASETPLQCLLAWKKNTVLDAEEEAIFDTIVESLKSPLDSDDIKRHLRVTKNNLPKKTTELPVIKTFNTFDDKSISRVKPKKPSAVLEYKETIQSLRRKRQAENEDSESNHSDESGSSDSLKNFRRRKKRSAGEEYRRTIEELRSKPKKIDYVKANAKPALINEREYVDNCIMDNDDDEEEEEEEEVNSQNSEEKFQEEIVSQSSKRRKSPSSKKLTLEDKIKDKPWLKSIPPDLIEDSLEESPEPIINDSLCLADFKKEFEDEVCTQAKDSSLDKVDIFTPFASKIEISVKVLGEAIRVSTSQSDLDRVKVDWLMREIAKRQPIISNSDSIASLKSNGNYVDESTPLSEIVSKDLELDIIKWKSLPLNVRYEKACSVSSHPDITPEVRPMGFKHTPNTHVIEVFKKFSSSRCLSLSNLKLSSLTLIPICKAIKFESFVQVLNLSNNYFGDKGVELIVKIFEKCIVEELYLSGCNITASGLYYFSEALSKVNELTKNGLEVLNLSHNPITYDATMAIDSIIEQLPNLRLLDIDHCELETTVSANKSINLTIVQGNMYKSPSRSVATN